VIFSFFLNNSSAWRFHVFSHSSLVLQRLGHGLGFLLLFPSPFEILEVHSRTMARRRLYSPAYGRREPFRPCLVMSTDKSTLLSLSFLLIFPFTKIHLFSCHSDFFRSVSDVSSPRFGVVGALHSVSKRSVMCFFFLFAAIEPRNSPPLTLSFTDQRFYVDAYSPFSLRYVEKIPLCAGFILLPRNGRLFLRSSLENSFSSTEDAPPPPESRSQDRPQFIRHVNHGHSLSVISFLTRKLT